MTGKRNSLQSSMTGCDEPSDNKHIDLTGGPSKRQRKGKEAKSSTAAPAMSNGTPSTYVPRSDLQEYRHMLHSNPEGVDFVFGTAFSDALDAPASRVATKYRVTKEQAIEELRRLLVIKAFVVDKYAKKISHTPLMDELWHALILDTMLYDELQHALGVTLHHRPSGASEQESEQREKRLGAMQALYTTFFSTEPLRNHPFQPSRPDLLPLSFPKAYEYFGKAVTISVRTTTGKTVAVTISSQATIDAVKSTFQDREGIPPNEQRLIYTGMQLEDARTLDSYGIENGAVIHQLLRLVGC